MNKLIHRKSNKPLIYVVEKKWWDPIYTPIKGLYIARIYKRVRANTYAPTSVRFAREQGTKPFDMELEKLLRKYEQTTKRTLQILHIQALLLGICKMPKADSAGSQHQHSKEGNL